MSVLVVDVTHAEVEAASDWLWQLGAHAIEERVSIDRDGEVNLIVGFANDDAALAARSLLTERWRCRLEGTGDESAWRDEWLRWIEPIEVAGFVVHAPWHDPDDFRSLVDAGAVPISIDPGQAFGSGHHPTTRLALEALQRLVQAGDRVLDAGCGTGILSIAAAHLGAAPVTGVDLDYDILEVAQANIDANGIAGSIELLADPIQDLASSFDICVANIVTGDLRPLMGPLVERTDRSLIVSGFLDHQFDSLLVDLAITVADRTSRDGWTCAVLTPLG